MHRRKLPTKAIVTAESLRPLTLAATADRARSRRVRDLANMRRMADEYDRRQAERAAKPTENLE